MKRDIEKDLMEIESAIKSNRERDNIFTMSVLQRCHELVLELKRYREIAALSKQIPKKPITYKETNRADCPTCGAVVRGIDKPFGDWCAKCGQAIDWKTEVEDE